MQSKCIKDMDPIKTNTDRLAIFEIKKRLQKAKRTLEDIQKLNIKQWTSKKISGKRNKNFEKLCD